VRIAQEVSLDMSVTNKCLSKIRLRSRVSLFGLGFMSAFDMIGVHALTLRDIRRGKTPGAVDAQALASDWNSVGDDFRSAMKKIEREFTTTR
jgi:hypothetical protein